MKIKKLRKNVALLTSIVMLVGSAAAGTFTAKADSTSLSYKVYNAQTGAYEKTYSIGNMEVSQNNNHLLGTVIGTDDRVQDFTKTAVVKITMQDKSDGKYYMGTGFIVNDHVIATAGHCVENKKNLEVKIFNTSGTLVKTLSPVKYHIPTDYVGSSAKDYGLLTVSEDLSDYEVFNLGTAIDGFADSNHPLSVTGFPGTVSGQNANAAYTGDGVCTEIKNGLIYFNADTSGGDSGGPVYTTKYFGGKVYYTVIGVHTSGFDDNSDTKNNHGVIINSNLLKFYLNNPELN